MTVHSGADLAGRAGPSITESSSVETPNAESPGARADGLWAERVGPGRYTGHNARGAAVLMGPADADDVFTPSELLKIALAGCVGMSADHPLARRLGTDVPVSVHVSGPRHADDQLYPNLLEELVVDLSGLEPLERDRAVTIVRRAIDRYCTVGRTLKQGTSVELTISGG
jgi:uncharacterized OsmC-like protein